MATAEQYAKWCIELIEGVSDDDLIADIMEAMFSDGFINEDDEWEHDEDED
jgi:hypothetical protein